MHGALPDGAVSVDGVLRIQNTQGIHGGTYTCTGKNSFSDDMASVQLRVGGEKSNVLIFVKLPSQCFCRNGFYIKCALTDVRVIFFLKNI